MIGLRRIYAVAKEKLFPKPRVDDKRHPRERFDDLATKIFTTSKSTIDERETQWRAARKRRPKT